MLLLAFQLAYPTKQLFVELGLWLWLVLLEVAGVAQRRPGAGDGVSGVWHDDGTATARGAVHEARSA